MKKLPRSIYLRTTIEVARSLIGKMIVRRQGTEFLLGMIVETEAYRADDPASHSFRGMTERNKVMFGNGGCLYVYFTYGMHYCANIVTGAAGKGEAVLIRAVEPVAGFDRMVKNRNLGNEFLNAKGKRSRILTNGPAKFAQAFGITTKHSGMDLLEDDIFITNGIVVPRSSIAAAPRIGISRAKEKKWRFYLKHNLWVSTA